MQSGNLFLCISGVLFDLYGWFGGGSGFFQFTFLFFEDECVCGGSMELFFLGLDFEGEGD